MAKLKVVHKWVGQGWVESFMLILGRVWSGRVGSLHLWVRLGRVKKIGPTSNSGAGPHWQRNGLTNTDYVLAYGQRRLAYGQRS